MGKSDCHFIKRTQKVGGLGMSVLVLVCTRGFSPEVVLHSAHSTVQIFPNRSHGCPTPTGMPRGGVSIGKGEMSWALP